LQSAFPCAQHKGDQSRERQTSLAGEGFVVDAMPSDKIGVMEGFGDFSQNFGMEVAKSVSYIYF
jgi:hypothetical protein